MDTGALWADGIAAIEAARALRPRAIIGFYSLPNTRYYGRKSRKWKQELAAVRPVLAHSDALFPSIYDYYFSSNEDPAAETTAAADEAYVRDNVRRALRAAGSKPVYPYVWGRYHDSNRVYGLQAIPRAEFRGHLEAASSARVEGHGIAGFVWWGSDTYFFPNRSANSFAPLHRRQLAALRTALSRG